MEIVMLRRGIGTLLVTALLLSGTLQAQTPPDPQTFGTSISVGYVLVSFAALDQKGRPIQDLQKKEVHLRSEGKTIATDLFDRLDNAPISFTILLDTSGSMGLAGKMGGARAAIAELLAKGRPGDDFALYLFARGLVAERVPFTEEKQLILKAVNQVQPFGKTAFFDALAEMPDKSLLGHNGSRAIILLTDGLDNASTVTRTELAKLLEGVNVPVYPLGLRLQARPKNASPTASETMSDVEILDFVARVSGGRLVMATEPQKLRESIDLIEKDLRTQYSIGFTPTGKGEVRYRPFTVAVPRRVKIIRVRSGYKGTEPPLEGSKRRGR
ncbi:MAG TPA: VWA domain-containing protein [Thermoanaerobaculia bacterium]|nr:VWA domain-containing protein [Thermoanaerobaculia bacterium]